MTDKSFSILIPSRGRIPLLIQCIKSLLSLAEERDKIEILVITDDDDHQTLSVPYPAEVTKLVRPRSIKLNEDYYNFAARKSVGRYVWGLGNDCYIKTKNWDTILSKKIEQFLADKPDRLLYGWPDNDLPSTHPQYNQYPAFPIVTREVVQVLDGHLPKELNTWGADGALSILWRRLIESRELVLYNDVELKHVCHHNGSYEDDEINVGIRKNVNRCELFPQEQEHYINLLNQHILKNKNATV